MGLDTYHKKRDFTKTSEPLGKKFSQAEKIMLQAGFFSGKSKGKTREYAFIYDFYVIRRKVPFPEPEMTNSEKYKYVRNCVIAYQKYLKKIENSDNQLEKNIGKIH